MIRSFLNSELEAIWTGKGVEQILWTERTNKIVMMLDLLHVAAKPADVELPSNRLEHKGTDVNGRVRFAVVYANDWQIEFSWQDGEAYDVDFDDFKRGS